MQHRDYELLNEVLSVTKACVDIRKALYKIAAIMATVNGFTKVAIVLLNEDQQDCFVFASHGLSDTEQSNQSSLISGICGRVLDSGEPIIVSHTQENALFPDVAHVSSQLFSYISVPIILENKILGTLSTERVYVSATDLEKERELLTVITSIISQRFRSFYNLQDIKRKLTLENTLLKRELRTYTFSNLIGKSKPMQAVFDQIHHVASSNATVLIRGESGTGKELVAHAIHFNSRRADKPFVRVNCSALSENLIESELFGHEKGAFTDAHETRVGRFELANKGTLFLDEIGELSPAIQVKLLRAIQEKTVERVGGSKTLKTDIRFIFATNSDLELQIQKGLIREDFYYRINVFAITLPSLRERREDIILIANHFMEKFARENDKIITRISPEATDLLNSWTWPGNVRELENCIERAVILASSSILQPNDLPPHIRMHQQSQLAKGAALELPDQPLETLVANYEKTLIESALVHTGGNKFKAAELLKTTNRIIGYKIEKYDIDPNGFKKREAVYR